jgi:hypothetical protein
LRVVGGGREVQRSDKEKKREKREDEEEMESVSPTAGELALCHCLCQLSIE